MNSGYLRVANTYSAIGFVPRGWPAKWLLSKQWDRLHRYQLVGPFVSRADWRSLGLAGPYAASGYYPPGPALLNVFAELGITCPPPPSPERLLHQLQLLAVLDGLSDSELATWWSETEVIQALAHRPTRFRVPDGLYRADTDEWVAVEIWSRGPTDPILLEKLRDVWANTYADRIRIISLDGTTTLRHREEVAANA